MDHTYICQVQKCKEKHYTVDVNGRDEVISIDRLKPAFQEVSPQDQVIPPLSQSTQHPGLLQLQCIV